MSVTNRIYGLLALIILFSGWQKAVPAPDQSSIAAVLLQQFETVFYSRPDLLFGSQASKNLSKHDGNTLRIPFAYLVGALDALGNGASADVLANSEAVLVGAKDFSPPAGLGGVRSRSCYVVVVQSGSAFDFRKYFHESPSSTKTGKTAQRPPASLQRASGG